MAQLQSRNQVIKLRIKTALFFAPAAILFALFFIGPMIMTVFFAFTNMSLTGSAAQALKFVGFENFVNFFTDPKMKIALINTFCFLIFSGILGQQCMGFLLAYLMRKKNKIFRRIIGFTIIIGWVTPEVVVSFMFSAFFADSGILNKIIEIFGISPISWLFTFPMASVIVANIWKGTAYTMMMYQAALDSVPDDITEASKIDGANGVQTLTRIILPMIKGTLSTTFVLVTLGTLGSFGLIYALTGGGPGLKTTTLSIFMYQKAFGAYQLGYGMAIALFILAIGIVLSIVYIRLTNGEKSVKKVRPQG